MSDLSSQLKLLPPQAETLANAQWGLAADAQVESLSDFDWESVSRVGVGNSPNPAWTAFIGWAHIYWKDGATNTNHVQIRNFQVFICHGPLKIWSLYQQGQIYGEEYLTDWVNNTHQAAPYFNATVSSAEVGFDHDYAFHFWPQSGRKTLPPSPIHGVLVVYEAKTVTTDVTTATDDEFLAGCGFDYWLDLNASWNGAGVNNADAGIGKLSYVTSDWTWHIMTTASVADINRLYAEGHS